jgi:photoactive yellow protein
MADSDPVDFEASDLSATIETLSQYELDHLSFGVILLDADGIVRFYSEAEARQSGYYRNDALGQNFWQIARCFDTDEFRGRIERAYAASPKIDLEIGWVGDFSDHRRELRVRVQSARSGGFWIFIQRDQQSYDASTPASGRPQSGPRPKNR